MTTADSCPRCHVLGRWDEAIGLFPNIRGCGACGETQRRCTSCYGWFGERALALLAEGPTCADCEQMAADFARHDATRRLAEIESILVDMRALLEEAQQELDRVRHA